MGYFHVRADRKFFHTESQLQTWPADIDGYRLYKTGNSGEEIIGIETNQEVELSLVIDAGQVFGKLVSSDLKIVEPGIVGPPAAKPVQIKLTAKGSGPAVVSALNDSGDVIASIKVACGHFENHDKMEVDLIAQICQGSDSLRIHALQRMLNNNRYNVFDQNGPSNKHAVFGNMACGIVAKFRGEEIFGFMGIVEYDHPYHEPIYTEIVSRDQVRYKPEKILNLRTHIGKMLRDGKPVRVGVLDSPFGMKPVNGHLVAYFAGGHSVLIVGADSSNKQFLYIDPWTGGSKMQYTGGIPGNKFSADSRYIGLFETEYDDERKLKNGDIRANLIRQSTTTEGTFGTAKDNYLEVVAAPWRL